MLGDWRDDVRRQPDAPVVTMAQASAALARVQKPPRRNRFALTVIGGVAAAVLCLGGFGAVVLDARPGDPLYGLRSTLFGERTQTRSEAVTLAAQELDQVQQLVNQGNWDAAQQKLVTLGPEVQSVSDAQSKQQLVEQYNSLTAKVIQRDPQATPPPPGVPPPVNPSSPLTFLQVPVTVATTTTTPSIPDLTTTSQPTTALPPTTPLPTPTTPLPTSTGPLPTPTTPLPTSTGPLPSPTTPSPTPTTALPTPTGPSRTPTTEPPTTLQTTVPTVPPTAQVTVTTTAVQAPPSLPVTVTTPPVTQSTVAPPPETPKVAPPPEAPRGPQRPPVVITTPTQAPGGGGPR
jgi:hypothetical protein